MPKPKSRRASTETSSSYVTRRRFLKKAAAASVSLIAAPVVVPASALGKDGSVAPSERIVMGCIGTGGRGTSNLGKFIKHKDVQIVAVCDFDKRSELYFRGRVCGREPAKELVEKTYAESSPGGSYKGGKAFADFRELLAIGDIDAVSVATPDHWHALVPITTAEIGHRSATICHLNNIAMLTGRKLRWDPAKETILDDPKANALLGPEMRAPWKLSV